MGAFEHGETVYRIPFARQQMNDQRRMVSIYGPEERVDGAGFDPAVTTETEGTTTVVPATLFLDHDQPAHKLDRWRVRGEVYETIGDPDAGRIINHFTGRKFRLEIEIRKVTG